MTTEEPTSTPSGTPPTGTPSSGTSPAGTPVTTDERATDATQPVTTDTERTTTATDDRTTGRAPAPGWAFGPGQVLAALGAIALVVSAFLNWQDFVGRTAHGTKVPVDFLVDRTNVHGDISILAPLAVAAVIIAIGVLMPGGRLLIVLGGILGLVVVGLYCRNVQRNLDLINTDQDVLDFISIGTYLAFAGSVAAIIGGLIPRRD